MTYHELGDRNCPCSTGAWTIPNPREPTLQTNAYGWLGLFQGQLYDLDFSKFSSTQNTIFIKGKGIKTSAMGSLDTYPQNSTVTPAICGYLGQQNVWFGWGWRQWCRGLALFKIAGAWWQWEAHQLTVLLLLSILSRQNILLLAPHRKTSINISFPLAPGHYGLSPLPSEHSKKQAEDRKDQGSPGEQSQRSWPAESEMSLCSLPNEPDSLRVQTAANHQHAATGHLQQGP